MSGIDLDTELPVGQRTRRDERNEPGARQLFIACLALALAAAVLRSSPQIEALAASSGSQRAPSVDPELTP